jgi:hypothetical protein
MPPFFLPAIDLCRERVQQCPFERVAFVFLYFRLRHNLSFPSGLRTVKIHGKTFSLNSDEPVISVDTPRGKNEMKI